MGTLYIISTPIGNLRDITLRAIDTLKSVDYILCEDTRVSGKLLKQYEINNKLVSFSEFNEDKKALSVIEDLINGRSIALVSDAGTPLISDPGYKLVRGAINKGFQIESIPGPSSVISALVVSGLPPDKFAFVGYLPKGQERKEKVLEAVCESQKSIKSTVIIFESPFRLLKTLESIKKVFGDIEVVVCRELTKIHEEVRREKISHVIGHFSQTNPRGEFVVLF